MFAAPTTRAASSRRHRPAAGRECVVIIGNGSAELDSKKKREAFEMLAAENAGQTGADCPAVALSAPVLDSRPNRPLDLLVRAHDVPHPFPHELVDGAEDAVMLGGGAREPVVTEHQALRPELVSEQLQLFERLAIIVRRVEVDP